MKVTVEKSWQAGKYIAKVQQGCRSFTLGYAGTEEEVIWVAKMFRIALKNHNEQVLEVAKRRKK